MTGLDNILSQIKDEARQEAEEQLTAARAQAEQRLADARAQAEQRGRELAAQGEQQAAAILERAESGAQLNRRNAMLAFKQALIRDVIAQAKESIRGGEDYFSLLLTLAGNYAQPGKAVMRLCAEDLARLPSDFSARLSEAAPQAEISLSREPAAIDGGFVLAYDGIDVNCSLDAVFEEHASEMQDRLRAVLFPAAQA